MASNTYMCRSRMPERETYQGNNGHNGYKRDPRDRQVISIYIHVCMYIYICIYTYANTYIYIFHLCFFDWWESEIIRAFLVLISFKLKDSYNI
jgi:hypothetical protein